MQFQVRTTTPFEYAQYYASIQLFPGLLIGRPRITQGYGAYAPLAYAVENGILTITNGSIAANSSLTFTLPPWIGSAWVQGNIGGSSPVGVRILGANVTGGVSFTQWYLIGNQAAPNGSTLLIPTRITLGSYLYTVYLDNNNAASETYVITVSI